MNDFHDTNYQNLMQSFRADRLPHALLFTGDNGIGKFYFANYLAKALLCQDLPVGNEPCNQCRSCVLFTANNHPDYYQLGLETNAEGKDAKDIKIDQIRNLSANLALKSHSNGLKVALVYPAERMNRNAANSLLKTLEEPTPDTLLILISSFPAQLPATIRSRCQKITFHKPSWDKVHAWLQARFPDAAVDKLVLAANGEPLTAIDIAEQDVLGERDNLYLNLQNLLKKREGISELAVKYSNIKLSCLIVNWFIFWVQDMIKIRSSGGMGTIMNTDYRNHLQALAEGVDLVKLFVFYDQLNKARLLLNSSANIQLVMESLLLSWLDLFSIPKQTKKTGG